eukprot:scaffold32223_cov83-Cyclotella_meneghiniana.AAC.1
MSRSHSSKGLSFWNVRTICVDNETEECMNTENKITILLAYLNPPHRHPFLSSFEIPAAWLNRRRIYSSDANASNLSNASIMASHNLIASVLAVNDASVFLFTTPQQSSLLVWQYIFYRTSSWSNPAFSVSTSETSKQEV